MALFNTKWTFFNHDFELNVVPVCLLCFLAVMIFVYFQKRMPDKLPPGPFVFPVIGNLPSMTGSDIFGTFRKLRSRYGDIFRVYVGQELMIVLNGYDSIYNALVKNGSSFTVRPNKAFNRLVIKNPGIVYADLKTWKEQRGFTQQALKQFGYSNANGNTLEDKINNEITGLLKELKRLKFAVDLKDYFSKSAANVVSQIIFGQRFEYRDRTFSEVLDSMSEITSLAAKANALLNCFPFLQHLPGDVLRIRHMRRLIDVTSEFYTNLYREHSGTYQVGTTRDFMDMYITEINKNLSREESEKNSFTAKRLLSIQRELLTGGGDTVSTVLLWVVFYLIKYPAIQDKLHADIQKIVGTGRQPSLKDRDNLPYVEATIMETLRISKVLPFAVPHSVVADTPFQGYLIPQNTTVLVNLESVLMDARVWHNPEEFRPERFLDSEGSLVKPKEFVPFSLGRRACVGQTLANKELFLYVTRLLQELEFILPPGGSALTADGILGFTYSPKPFHVHVKPRRCTK